MSKPSRLVPSQNEVEKYLSDLLTYGDKEELAAWLDCSTSLISQECNPDNPEKKSKYYQGIRFLWACFMLRPELGQALVNKIILYSELWKPAKHSTSADVPQLAEKINGKLFELIRAQISSAPMQERLSLALQAKTHVETIIDGLRFDDVENAEEELTASVSR